MRAKLCFLSFLFIFLSAEACKSKGNGQHTDYYKEAEGEDNFIDQVHINIPEWSILIGRDCRDIHWLSLTMLTPRSLPCKMEHFVPCGVLLWHDKVASMHGKDLLDIGALVP